jgi:hypothetical protein
VTGKPGLIAGVVRDPQGRPVEGARVYFSEGPDPLPDVAALTNSDGEFSLAAPSSGTYRVECNADEFDAESLTVNAESGQRVSLDIKLKK